MAKLLGVEPPKREEPFKSEPLPRFDPTAAMGMPLETMREMARLDCGDPRADAAALNAGREMVEQDSKSDPSQQRAVGNGRGWVEPAPLRRTLALARFHRITDGSLRWSRILPLGDLFLC